MHWNTTSALAAQRRAEVVRDAALVRAGRAVRNRKARDRKAREGAVGLR